jgi:hypothetical protein
MKHVHNEPNLQDWTLSASESELANYIKRELAELIKLAFADEDTRPFFPVEYSRDPENGKKGSDGFGGAEVGDPLTMYLRVALANDTDDLPAFSFNLRETLNDTLEICREDGSYSYGLGRLSKSLRELADSIDSAIEEGKTD